MITYYGEHSCYKAMLVDKSSQRLYNPRESFWNFNFALIYSYCNAFIHKHDYTQLRLILYNKVGSTWTGAPNTKASYYNRCEKV